MCNFNWNCFHRLPKRHMRPLCSLYTWGANITYKLIFYIHTLEEHNSHWYGIAPVCMLVCSLTMLLSWNYFPHISHWYNFTFEYVAACLCNRKTVLQLEMFTSLITRMLICLSGDNYYSYKKLWEEITTPSLPWQNSSHTNPSTWTCCWDNRNL